MSDLELHPKGGNHDHYRQTNSCQYILVKYLNYETVLLGYGGMFYNCTRFVLVFFLTKSVCKASNSFN